MQDSSTSSFALPPILDLGAAKDLLDQLRRAPPTALDASGVTLMTSPCAQVIMAALSTHPSLAIANPSEAFTSAFADLGLEWRTASEHQPSAAVESAPDTRVIELPSMPVPEGETNGAAMTKRILTIDDSRTIRDMLKLTLSEAGYEVLQAVDGQEGIEMLGRERVDLVITDINMPKKDGYAVIRHMRGQDDHKATPILVLTTESEAEKRNIAREAGATGWMVKPFDPERLLATVSKVTP
jgi:two-component system chemotaxis response regulator CheY